MHIKINQHRFGMISSIYLKKNKDYNNVFLQDGKILKVGRSLEVPWSLPRLPPLTAFFSWGRNILFQISGGGICPSCFETGGAYAHCAPRLRTPLCQNVNKQNYLCVADYRDFQNVALDLKKITNKIKIKFLKSSITKLLIKEINQT